MNDVVSVAWLFEEGKGGAFLKGVWKWYNRIRLVTKL